MIRPARVHLALFNQRIIPFIKLKQLLALFPTAYVYFPVESTLQYGAKVAECVLHVLNIDHPGCKILEIVHYQLLLVRHEYSYPVLLGKQFERALSHLGPFLDLLETAQVEGSTKFLQSRVEIQTFLLNLVTQDLNFLLETLDSVFFLHHVMISLLFQSTSHLVHSRSNPHVEVRYLVKEECLKKFHLSFNVSEVSFVNLRENARAGVVDGRHGLLLDYEDLISHG